MLNIYIANLGKYNEGELVGKWLELPATEQEINELMVKIGLGYFDNEGEYVAGLEVDGIFYEEWAIHDYETDISGIEVGEWDNIWELSDMVEELDKLDKYDMKKVEAIMEYEGYGIMEAIDKMDEYQLYTDITNEYDLGYYWMVESGCYEIPKHLENYIDYERFGRDITFDGRGMFTENGWLEAC